MQLHKIWVEQCEAARNVEGGFNRKLVLDYLIGEKFINFLEAAEDNADFRGEIPAFVAEIKTIFDPWQLAQYLEIARETEKFDPSVYEGEDPEDVEMERKRDIRRCAADLLLVERAREWLLED